MPAPLPDARFLLVCWFTCPYELLVLPPLVAVFCYLIWRYVTVICLTALPLTDIPTWRTHDLTRYPTALPHPPYLLFILFHYRYRLIQVPDVRCSGYVTNIVIAVIGCSRCSYADDGGVLPFWRQLVRWWLVVVMPFVLLVINLPVPIVRCWYQVPTLLTVPRPRYLPTITGDDYCSLLLPLLWCHSIWVFCCCYRVLLLFWVRLVDAWRPTLF